MHSFYAVVIVGVGWDKGLNRRRKCMESKFINEYPCTYSEEYQFLKSKGFRYSFVKNEFGVTVWKYKKSKVLYEALIEFYYDK